MGLAAFYRRLGRLAGKQGAIGERQARVRIKNIISWSLSLLLIGAGVALSASFFLGQGTGSAIDQQDLKGFSVPRVGTEGSADKTLKVTIPAMARVEDATIPTTTGGNKEALRNNAAIHLKGTGFPWQEQANVYLAGHRLGYPGTESFLAFYDLNELKEGDKIFVTDASGKKYTYRVFKESIVDPTDVWVTRPIEGKNVVTLQTCTLPDYSQRLIVQAELVGLRPLVDRPQRAGTTGVLYRGTRPRSRRSGPRRPRAWARDHAGAGVPDPSASRR